MTARKLDPYTLRHVRKVLREAAFKQREMQRMSGDCRFEYSKSAHHRRVAVTLENIARSLRARATRAGRTA